MEQELKFDKYGYAVNRSSREVYNNLRVYIHYVYCNNKDYECFKLLTTCKKLGLFKNIKHQKNMEQLFKNKNIVESIAYVITQKYGFMNNLTPDYDLIMLIKSIPSSIITNNEAVKELLANLPQENMNLLYFVAEQIKEIKEDIKKKKRLKKLKSVNSL